MIINPDRQNMDNAFTYFEHCIFRTVSFQLAFSGSTYYDNGAEISVIKNIFSLFECAPLLEEAKVFESHS